MSESDWETHGWEASVDGVGVVAGSTNCGDRFDAVTDSARWASGVHAALMRQRGRDAGGTGEVTVTLLLYRGDRCERL